MGNVYVTSFCNFGHDLVTGRPVGHECYILPTAALRMEYLGNVARAVEILQTKGKGPIVKGRPRR